MAERNFRNRTLYKADNLDVLRGMNSETVDLIATDPPFKKGRDFHATPGSLADGAKFQDRWSWERDVHEDWVERITENWPRTMNVIQGSRSSYGDDMGAFLCFMAVRLIEMRRVLKATGSIYVHCDHTASHYLKELMDAIFGRKRFVNEVVWYYKTGGMSKRWFGRKHDVLLFYSKAEKYTFNPQREKSYLSHKYGFSNIELFEDSGGTYRIVGMRDVWDISALRGNQPETVGYPTQKPLTLYERVVNASSNEGDLVLDPFCGCATTPIAAERLKRQWVGIDIWEGARDVVLDRMAKEGLVQEGEKSSRLFTTDIHFTADSPIRTDDGVEAIPYLVTPERIKEPPDPHTRAEKVELLLQDYGYICQGCLREFDDRLYFELDHNVPRSHDGSNLLRNRILLCSPCNRIKSDTMTLHGLRQDNWRRERMSERANQMKKELSSRQGRGGRVKAGNVP